MLCMMDRSRYGVILIWETYVTKFLDDVKSCSLLFSLSLPKAKKKSTATPQNPKITNFRSIFFYFRLFRTPFTFFFLSILHTEKHSNLFLHCFLLYKFKALDFTNRRTKSVRLNSRPPIFSSVQFMFLAIHTAFKMWRLSLFTRCFCIQIIPG